MKRIKVLLLMTLLIAVLLSGCSPSPEEAVQNAQEYVAANDYATAESELLSVLEKEPENELVKEELGKLYRQWAVTMPTVDEMLTCLEKASGYIEGFEYTKEELEKLANLAIETKQSAYDVYVLCTEYKEVNGESAIDESLYTELLKESILQCESPEEQIAMADAWLNKEPYSMDALKIRAKLECEFDVTSIDFEQEYAKAMELCDENSGAYVISEYNGAELREEYSVYNGNNDVTFSTTAIYEWGNDTPNLYNLYSLSAENVKYSYDENGKVISISSDDYPTITGFYDGNNLIRAEESQGIIAEYKYDGKGRVTYRREGESIEDYNEETPEYFTYNDANETVTTKYVDYTDKEGDIWMTKILSYNYFFNIPENMISVGEGTTVLSGDADALHVTFNNGKEVQFYKGGIEEILKEGVTINVTCESSGIISENAISLDDAGVTYKIEVVNQSGEVVKEYVEEYDEYGLLNLRQDDNWYRIYLTEILKNGKIICKTPVDCSFQYRSIDFTYVNYGEITTDVYFFK